MSKGLAVSEEENRKLYKTSFVDPLFSIVRESCEESMKGLASFSSSIGRGYLKRLEELRIERNRLIEEKASLSDELEKQRSIGKSENTKSQEEKALLKKEIVSLESAITSLRSSNDGLTKKILEIDVLKQEKQSLIDKIDELESSLRDAKRRNDELIKSNQKLEKENKEIFSNTIKAQENLNVVQGNYINVKSENQRLEKLNQSFARILKDSRLPVRLSQDSSGEVIDLKLSSPIDVEELFLEAQSLREQNQLLESNCEMLLKNDSIPISKEPVSKAKKLEISEIEKYANRTRDSIFSSLLKALVFIVYSQQSEGKSEPLEIWKSVDAKPLKESYEFFKIVYFNYQALFLQLLFDQSVFYLGLEGQKSILSIDSVNSDPSSFVSKVTRKYFDQVQMNLGKVSLSVESVTTEFV